MTQPSVKWRWHSVSFIYLSYIRRLYWSLTFWLGVLCPSYLRLIHLPNYHRRSSLPLLIMSWSMSKPAHTIIFFIFLGRVYVPLSCLSHPKKCSINSVSHDLSALESTSLLANSSQSKLSVLYLIVASFGSCEIQMLCPRGWQNIAFIHKRLERFSLIIEPNSFIGQRSFNFCKVFRLQIAVSIPQEVFSIQTHRGIWEIKGQEFTPHKIKHVKLSILPYHYRESLTDIDWRGFTEFS